jgi:hypothetical protein
MSNLARPFFVHCVSLPEGERFLILYPETMTARAFLNARTLPFKPGEQWSDVMRRFFAQESLLTEKGLRTKLHEIGISEESATAQIERARKVTALNSEFSWDHVTSIGFRNRDGQQVIRKTGREGSVPGQRVFILHCTVCDHEYGTDGSDIYDRLCPKCQDGPAGLPT